MSADMGLSPQQLQVITDILTTAVPSIEQVKVFGSRSTGRFRPQSDLDLVIYGSIDDSLCDHLWTLFGDSNLPFGVDLKNYRTIDYQPLKDHIDAVARPLLVRRGSHLRPVCEQAG
ncbi:MAG: nucleotidyltransferase domain-containing protein [Gammaproteobacteria bacterium]|nr:nucleotidyltransferase domain-containing protein [Gammaproteobacteria bacterium]